MAKRKLFDAERLMESVVGAQANASQAGGDLTPEEIEQIMQGPALAVFRGDSDVLATKAHMYISFMHESSQKDVYFKAFITAFNETYNSDWVSETVFGRSDPIHHFKQTSRRIALSFKVPAATYSEAFENLGRVQSLIQMLYPNYSQVGTSAQTITQNPFIRLKVMNLARQAPPATDLANAGPNPTPMSKYVSDGSADKGLLGVVSNLTVNHNLENKDVGVLQFGSNTVLPKMIEVNLDFNVVHEHRLGWTSKGFDNPAFPYGIEMDDEFNREKREFASAKGFDVRIDEIQAAERARVMAEQDRANAEARYQTAFGKARFNKDKKFIDAYEKRAEYLESMENRHDLTEKERKQYEKAKKKQHTQSANYDYLSSAQRGAEASAAAGDVDYDFVD